MTILKGNKVILVKELDTLKKVGETFEVGNITDTHITIRTIDTRMAICAVETSDFNKYFVLKELYQQWTPWQMISLPNGSIVSMYRTNGKKVIVKFRDVSAVASCNKNYDDFDLSFGIRLAHARCEKKFALKTLNETSMVLHNTENEIKQLLQYAENFNKNNNDSVAK